MSFFDEVRQGAPGRRRVVVADAPPAAAPADTYSTNVGTGPNGGPASGNTGVAGDQSQTVVTPPVSTRLMEGDAAKLGDPNHALKSPKYSFLQLANSGKYGYHQLPEMLAELQRTHPEFWNGWTTKNDVLQFTGDKSQLHDAWKGATEVDAIGNFTNTDGSSPTGWRWGHNAPEDAVARAQAAGGGVPGASPMTLPSGSSPSQSGAAMNQGAGGGQANAGGGYDNGGGQGWGSLMQPWEFEFDYDDFKAPTEADMLADPGYKFRRDQGQKAIERSAAAEGTLLGGGTLRALMDFGQGLGSQEYGNVYARKQGEFQDARKQAWDEYSNAFGVFNRNQEVPFNRLAAIAGLGQTATSNMGNQAGAFAANYGNTMQNGANAQAGYWGDAANAGASGIMGSANAWGQAAGNIGNNFMQSYYLRQLMGKG